MAKILSSKGAKIPIKTMGPEFPGNLDTINLI